MTITPNVHAYDCQCPTCSESTFRGFSVGRVEVIRSAWECPRCQRINAPHVDACSCTPDSSAWSTMIGGVALGQPIKFTTSGDPAPSFGTPIVVGAQCSGCGGNCTGCRERARQQTKWTVRCENCGSQADHRSNVRNKPGFPCWICEKGLWHEIDCSRFDAAADSGLCDCKASI